VEAAKRCSWGSVSQECGGAGQAGTTQGVDKRTASWFGGRALTGTLADGGRSGIFIAFINHLLFITPYRNKFSIISGIFL
jgi:hypothetical protein